MGEEYAVCLGSENVGSASVSREGLYYRISCRCRLSGSVPYRIIVSGEKEADLGLCVPLDDMFGVETRVPIKKIGEGGLHFKVLPKHPAIMGEFIPISPEEPFRYIARLKEAHLARKDGQLGLVLIDQSQDQWDSDRNP